MRDTATHLRNLDAALPVLRTLAHTLREADWRVTEVIDRSSAHSRLVDVLPGDQTKSLLKLSTNRVRTGEHGAEYVIAWAEESDTGKDIVITKPDIDNLMRAKAAIYAGYVVLAQSVGMGLGDVEQMLIGGSFGQYLNIEKAIQIGLLPDLPWDRFKFLGNTAARGAYMALLRRDAREEIAAIAKKMTYLELAADNAFTDQFMAALFLPHTDLTQFPSMADLFQEQAPILQQA